MINLEKFLNIKLSFGLKKDIEELLNDIAKRDNVSFEEILSSEEIKKVLENEKIQGKRKGEKIKEILLRRRFPELFKLIDNFEKDIQRDCRDDSGCAVRKIPFAEGHQGNIYNLE